MYKFEHILRKFKVDSANVQSQKTLNALFSIDFRVVVQNFSVKSGRIDLNFSKLNSLGNERRNTIFDKKFKLHLGESFFELKLYIFRSFVE